MQPRIVIVGYKPKPGKEAALNELMKTHHSILLRLNLVTARLPIMMTAKDETVVEVFEWISAEAIRSAHTNVEVLEMWKNYGEVCEYIPVGQLPECNTLFSDFTPLDQ